MHSEQISFWMLDQHVDDEEPKEHLRTSLDPGIIVSSAPPVPVNNNNQNMFSNNELRLRAGPIEAH